MKNESYFEKKSNVMIVEQEVIALYAGVEIISITRSINLDIEDS